MTERGLNLFQRNWGTGNWENFVLDKTIEKPALWQIRQTSGGWIMPLCNALRYMNSGIVFPGQSKAKGGQKNHKGIHGVKIRERLVREERRNGKKCS